MRNSVLVPVLCLSACSLVAIAGGAGAGAAGSSATGSGHASGAGAHASGAHFSGAATRDGAAARGSIGREAASGFIVTKQMISGRNAVVASFKTGRPLTDPERQRLNHDGFLETKAQGAVFYCRPARDALFSRDMECFGPDQSR